VLEPEVAHQVQQFLSMLQRTPFDELRLFAVRPGDAVAHEDARARASVPPSVEGETACGRTSLETWPTASWLRRSRLRPTIIGLAWRRAAYGSRAAPPRRSSTPALAVVTRDLVDEITFKQLVRPCAKLVR
jgi:hypothetical protein